MTEQEWKKVEELFSEIYGYVELDCDGYRLTLRVGKIGKLLLAIVPYVNGKLEGGWFTKDCEERRRFFQKKERSAFSKKYRDQMKKILGKRIYDATSYEKKITVHSFYWRSYHKLKAHLIANNKEIKLIQSL